MTGMEDLQDSRIDSFAAGTERGFSAVEMLLALAILVIAATMAIPFYRASIYKAEVTTAVSDLTAVSNAIDTYVTVNGELPANLEEIGYDKILDP